MPRMLLGKCQMNLLCAPGKFKILLELGELRAWSRRVQADTLNAANCCSVST